MKVRHLVEHEQSPGRIYARFGSAALIRRRRGKWILHGGTRNDRLEALEWISLFLHEAVVQTEAE